MTKDFDACNEKKSRSVCAAMADAADTGKRVLSEKEPERTCRDDGVDAFRCTGCGAFAKRDAVTDLCGPIPIRYCPNCGRKVEGK